MNDIDHNVFSAAQRVRSAFTDVTGKLQAAQRRLTYIRASRGAAHPDQYLYVTDASRTLEHVRPRAAGGTNVPTNLVTACRRCNSARQARRPVLTADVARRVRNATRRRLDRELGRRLAAQVRQTTTAAR